MWTCPPSRLRTETATGAARLYEKAGMRVVNENATYEKVLRAGVDLRTQELDR